MLQLAGAGAAVPCAGRHQARWALARERAPVTRAPRAAGRYLVLSISLGGGAFNRLWYVPLSALPVNASTGALDFGRYDMRLPAGQRVALPLTKLVDDLNAAWTLVAVNGTLWTLHTSLAAPRFRSAHPNPNPGHGQRPAVDAAHPPGCTALLVHSAASVARTLCMSCCEVVLRALDPLLPACLHARAARQAGHLVQAKRRQVVAC